MDGFGLAHRISRQQDRLLDRLRDRSAADAAGFPGTADTFAALIGEEFALLVTFRRSGEPVPTPVWFGMDHDHLYVESLADAGKVKRLRHDRRVRVAPCTFRGKPTGPFTDGVGRILGAADEDRAESALDRHYGLRRRLYVRLGVRLGVRSVYLELVPTRLGHPGRAIAVKSATAASSAPKPDQRSRFQYRTDRAALSSKPIAP